MTHRGTYLRLILAAAICVGMFVFFRSAAEPVNNEFFNLYAGASIGPRHLYEPERFAEFARSLHSAVMPARLYYTRMPYFAVFTKPLAWLAFPVALTIWRLVQGAALVASVWLWPGPKPTMGVVTLISLAAVLVVWFAQDVGLVLFFVSLAVALWQKQRPLLAGLAFSLCLSKPHLVIFVPLAMLIRKDGRFLAGATLGAATQILLGFAVAPWNWPAQWLATLANPAMHPNVNLMPGLRYLAQTPPGLLLALLILASLVFGVSRAAVTQPMAQATALALAAGVVGNFHSYAVDCILLLPLTAIAVSSRNTSERLTGIFLASPFPVLAMLFGYPGFLQIAVLALILLPVFRPGKVEVSQPMPA